MILQRYPHMRYHIVDVLPARNLSRWYIHQRFPNASLQSLPPADAASLKDIDLFYSSSVLSELRISHVEFYFSLIDRVGHYFYLKDWIHAFESRVDESSFPARPSWKRLLRHRTDVELLYGAKHRGSYKSFQMFESVWEIEKSADVTFIPVKLGPVKHMYLGHKRVTEP